MNEVIIAGYLRTAQSRSSPKDPERDWLHDFRADELVELLVPEVLDRAGIKAEEVDDFILGCSMGVNENFSNGGRSPIFLADLPETIPAKFVDQQCGSAMAAIHIGYMEIATGNADIVLTAGMEHMTRVPLDGGETVKLNMKLFTEEKYRHWNIPTALNTGLTAQKLLEETGYTRRDMDEWAFRSHKLAAKAQEDGFFDEEILPIEAKLTDGSTITVDMDQAVRPDINLESLAALKPAFGEGTDITTGTSSPMNTGASSMILMSKETAHKKGIKPLATIRAISFVGVDPTIMGTGPVLASKKALKSAGLEVKDIDYWEINEPFSIVAQNCIEKLGIDPDKINIHGGGLAIGHPLGATGIRLTGTLARILNEKKARYGLATTCVRGGQGVATIIEREEYY